MSHQPIHRLISLENNGSEINAVIEKQPANNSPAANRPNGKTFVLFSGDLDKAIAAFIMANAAASMGRKVTLFFTFWGLNILRRPERVSVKKSFVEKMFGFMMPRGTKKLGRAKRYELVYIDRRTENGFYTDKRYYP